MLSPLLSLSPQVVKCGYWYASKHTGQRRGRDRQVCSGSKRLQITLECGHQKLKLAQVLVVDQSRIQSRMAFALDTACKSGPVHGQTVIVADTRREECSSEGTGPILETNHHHAKQPL